MADISTMIFSKVYPMLVQKVVRKGRTAEEAIEITCWLTGYTPEQLSALETEGASYGDFINQAPAWNPLADHIKGSICGIKVETIEEPFMKKVRQLDKLIDELAKGKEIAKIIAKLNV
ncbi:MAG: DUF2200 domain-containing protein [Bacteroidaceae bacterium]|nr:DUF2200 domain-containing protein [Bacteroidaceae bacterium]